MGKNHRRWVMSLIPRKQVNPIWRSPFYEMDKLHKEINRLFDFGYPGHSGSDVSLLDGVWAPAVDVVEKKDSIVVKADLPGLTKEDISVSIENNILTISGEKKLEQEHKDGDVVRSERYYGSFNRAFTLPSTVDPNKVNAKFESGVLELTLTKKEEAKPRQIRIDVK
jgi:HSP20 family protein